MKITICKDFGFEAAQSLPHFPAGHKCRHIHGHSFHVTIAVTGEVNPQTGIFYDHADISAAMRPLIALVDHAHLNEIPGLENPTIELMARWFWVRLEPLLPGLSEITLHETPRARCIYRGD
jgi:6-pyruvoyltetrahydropterin/6-carboxytetrahydropterin synthase